MNNRAFLYGDGFFESLYCGKGKHLPLWDYHRQRAKESAQKLGMDWPEKWDEDLLLDQVTEMCLDDECRLRLTFYRNSKGLYTPLNDGIQLDIQSAVYEPSPAFSGVFPLINARAEDEIMSILNHLDSRMAAVSDHQKFADNSQLSNIKSVSAQLYVQVGLEKRRLKTDEMILLNHNNNLCECLNGNLWIQQGEKLYGPDATDGPVEGVMKRFLITKFPSLFNVRKQLHLEDLFAADAIYCSNAVRGLSKLRLLSH
jgi:branched-chain amino acid aminotransferase